MVKQFESIPESTLNGIKALLKPYGVKLENLTTQDESMDHYMTIKEVEVYLGVERWYIGRLIKSKKLSAIKLSPTRGGKVLISKHDLDAFIQSHKV